MFRGRGAVSGAVDLSSGRTSNGVSREGERGGAEGGVAAKAAHISSMETRLLPGFSEVVGLVGTSAVPVEDDEDAIIVC